MIINATQHDGVWNCGVHSWSAFVSKAGERTTRPPVRGAETSGTAGGREHWYGTPNLQTAVDMATKGWPEGAQHIARTLDSMAANETVRPDWALSMIGQRPCVEAYVAGDPECMWSMDAGERIVRTMTLCVPASYGGGCDSADIRTYAAAVAAVARQLEASGVDTAIWAVRSGRGDEGRAPEFLYAVQVRELGEPMDLAKVAFAFHPSMLRRLHFCFGEIVPALADLAAARDGYARPLPLTEDKLLKTFGSGSLGDGTLTCLPGPSEMFLGYGARDIADYIGPRASVERICEVFARNIAGRLAKGAA